MDLLFNGLGPFAWTFSRAKILAIALVMSASIDAFAEDFIHSKKESINSSNRWLLLCCGLSGDAIHQAQFESAVENILTHAETVLKIPSTNTRALLGSDEMIAKVQALAPQTGLCTAQNIESAISWLQENAGADQEAWIILLGHAHHYGKLSQFNIPGPDIDQDQFAVLANQLTAGRQVILQTTPVSGFWIRPLSAKNRVIITATEPAMEFTATEMPYALGDVLAGKAQHQNLEDIDGDGNVTLLDLYLAINLEIEGRFRTLDRLQTEHAQLDDNGDGKGSELQTPYLPIVPKDKEQPILFPAKPPVITSSTLDGYLSRQFKLGKPSVSSSADSNVNDSPS
ncbi:hypothetical protein SH449x_004904 [Pirellulaceae bacterium SH449]